MTSTVGVGDPLRECCEISKLCACIKLYRQERLYLSGYTVHVVNTLCVSSRASSTRPSPTLAISAKANAMKAEGIDVISFGAGEPDFPTPEPICAAAHEALDSNFTKYTATPGMMQLREAIANKLRDDNGIEVAATNVVVSNGAKQSLFNALMTLVDPGDEVIVLSPYWMTYIEQIALAGGTPVVVRSSPENGFLPDVDQIAAHVTPRTKAIVLNSPCNPTGAVYPRDVLEGIANLAVHRGLWVICDEIYEKLIYEGREHISIASLGREIAAQTVTINGCSKSFAMTGWRIGFAAAPKEVADAMACLQDCVTSNANSIAQKGAIAAYAMPRDKMEAMRSEFEIRRNLMYSELCKVDGVQVNKPQGAFYFLLGVSNFLKGEIKDDTELASRVLDEAKVATVPGSVFDAPGFIRLSYTASQTNIKRGVERLAGALLQLSG